MEFGLKSAISIALTKDGTIIPEVLCAKLEENEYALGVFLAMRPSCQKKYVSAISQAKNIEQKLDTIIKEIIEYGRRHNKQILEI